MISLIVCSVNPGLLNQLRANVAATIGVDFELIAIDNQNNRYGICQAYNLGKQQATYPFVCFLHEDVLFLTPDWGLRIVAHLSDHRTGLIGLAGGDAKPALPASWSSCLHSNQINIVQGFKDPQRPPKHLRVTDGDAFTVSKPAVALDGVFLATRRDIATKFQFDEKNLTGFHGYDNDYSLQIGQQYEIKVIFDVDLHHLSAGSLNKEWMSSQVIVYKKWKKQLPQFVDLPESKDIQFHHWKSFQIYMDNLLKLGYSKAFIWGELLRYSFNTHFSARRFGSLCKFILTSRVHRGEELNP